MTADFADLDLHLLASADAHAHAKERIDQARISAEAQGVQPIYRREDIDAVSSGSWRFLRYDEIGHEQPGRLGGRLYLLAFEGLVRYIKIGMIKGRELDTLRKRVRDHEHAAEVHQCFLLDAGPRSPAPQTQWPKSGKTASGSG
ncbi:hypothetical protein [Streptomyces tauricus]|uniref:hypothetical protein n=1 Tax=Streptomyces tauricus TaxID=68274 RepID=UPI00343FB698